MKDSNHSQSPEWVKELIEDPLILPEDKDFQSSAPLTRFRQILELSERTLPFVNARPDFIEMKIARSFDVPFKL